MMLSRVVIGLFAIAYGQLAYADDHLRILDIDGDAVVLESKNRKAAIGDNVDENDRIRVSKNTHLHLQDGACIIQVDGPGRYVYSKHGLVALSGHAAKRICSSQIKYTKSLPDKQLDVAFGGGTRGGTKGAGCKLDLTGRYLNLPDSISFQCHGSDSEHTLEIREITKIDDRGIHEVEAQPFKSLHGNTSVQIPAADVRVAKGVSYRAVVTSTDPNGNISYQESPFIVLNDQAARDVESQIQKCSEGSLADKLSCHRQLCEQSFFVEANRFSEKYLPGKTCAMYR